MNPIARRAGHAVGRRVPTGLAWRLRFLAAHRRWPRLKPPRTFSEKILWRILYDRRRELVDCTDKLRAKQLVSRACPEIRVPATLWKGLDARDLVGLRLPDRWVIKPNNSTSLVAEGRGQVDSAEADRLAALTEGWTDGPHDPASAWRWPWAYSQAERCLLVEEFVGDRLGQLDWRGYVLGGELRAAIATEDPSNYPHNAVTFLDSDLRPIPVTRPNEQLRVPPGRLSPVPEGLRTAFEQVARATGLEAVRVDLFHDSGCLWFGEATAYPVDGLAPYRPRSYDLSLGSYWPDQPAPGAEFGRAPVEA